MRSLSAGLVPIKRMDMQNIGKAIKHPAKTLNNAISSRECRIQLFSNNSVEFQIYPALRYSNLVFNPELKLGWIVLSGSQKTFEGKPLYIVHPEVPYTLNILKSSREVDLNLELQQLKEAGDQEISGMGLPDHLLKITCSALARLASDKWLAGFDEIGGSGVVFLFGGAAGLAIGLMIGVIGTLAALAMFANAT
jgi:hypothetical protein